MKGGLCRFFFPFFTARFPQSRSIPFPPGGFFVRPKGEVRMDQLQKLALQVAKEIIVKFIEVGRISPANFSEHFESVYDDVYRSVAKSTPIEDQSVESK